MVGSEDVRCYPVTIGGCAFMFPPMRWVCTILVWLAVAAVAVLPAAGGHAGLHAAPDAQAASHSDHTHDGAQPAGAGGHEHGGVALGDCDEAVAGHCLVFVGPGSLPSETVLFPLADRQAPDAAGNLADRAHDTETPPPRA